MIIVRYDILTRVFITVLLLTHNDKRLENFFHSRRSIKNGLSIWKSRVRSLKPDSFTISKSHKRTALLIVRWYDLSERSRLRNGFQKGICDVVATQCALWRKWTTFSSRHSSPLSSRTLKVWCMRKKWRFPNETAEWIESSMTLLCVISNNHVEK